MYSEKKIVNIWLQQRGYSVVNNLNAGRNRVVDTLAIKLEKDKPIDIQHIEVSCSVTKTSEKRADVIEKFKNKSVEKKIAQYLTEHIGSVPEYKKVFISTSDYDIDEIIVHRFENIFFEVMDNLDKQNYNDPIIRTLQLVKYLSIAEPDVLAKLIKKKGGSEVLKMQDREQFLQRLLLQKETKRILAKESFEPILADILKESTLSRPDVLAENLHKNILNPRSKKKFLNSFTEHKDAKGVFVKPKKKHRSLQYYLKAKE